MRKRDFCSPKIGWSLLAIAFVGGLLPLAFASEEPATQKAFFGNLKELCGRSFDGVTEFPLDPKHDFAGKKLIAKLATCTGSEIRIPFRVEDDTSRTWVLSLGEDGLLLKHDHRHADGTPDKVTMYGGWAVGEGTPFRQRFAADADTAKLIPEAATNVWTIEISEDKRHLTYALERNGQPRYKAVLHLTASGG